MIIGMGGFAGAVLRFLVGGWVQRSASYFPFGTLAVNVTGSFLLGLVIYLSEYGGFFDTQTRNFLAIGILGAYTTMSTFGYESYRLLEAEETLLFAVNVIGTVAATLIAIHAAKIMVLTIVNA